jgi:hypothetical protein
MITYYEWNVIIIIIIIIIIMFIVGNNVTYPTSSDHRTDVTLYNLATCFFRVYKIPCIKMITHNNNNNNNNNTATPTTNADVHDDDTSGYGENNDDVYDNFLG